MNESVPQPGLRSRSVRRTWLLRLAAVAFGLSVFVVLEIVCRIGGWGQPDLSDDPFVGFSELQPLFVKQGDRYRTAPARLKFFAEQSFPEPKSPGTVRIFCLGGSTVQGRPFGPETSFTKSRVAKSATH